MDLIKPPLHFCIRACVAEYLNTLSVGSRFSLMIGIAAPITIRGEIREIIEQTHGKLILVRNTGSTGIHWITFPLWLSLCGQSGLVAPWKSPEVAEAMKSHEDAFEREALNSMAL